MAGTVIIEFSTGNWGHIIFQCKNIYMISALKCKANVSYKYNNTKYGFWMKCVTTKMCNKYKHECTL